jgi:hypothetical protein
MELTMACDDIAEWRTRLADYDRANAALRRTESQLEAAFAARAAHPEGAAAFCLGVRLAQHRRAEAERYAAEAAFRLTGARSIDEVMWSVPDEI